MKHLTQLMAIVGLLILGSAAQNVADIRYEQTVDRAAESAPGGHDIVGGTLAERYKVYLGIALYERAGLTLPPLQISIHPDQAGCDGNPGVFNKDGSGTRIDLCADLIRHELAHAYTYHNLDDATRAKFVEHAKLPTWGDHSFPHASRAIELAANTISWNVAPELLSAADVELYDEFLYRYELLTGKVSPRI